MAENTPKSGHHHGDLRNALVRAGIEILSEDGIDKLTLRRCAARAGVSHAAPAHHFNGIEGLRGAIAEEGFRVFRNYMLDARGGAGDDPHERVKAICRGYLYFAQDNPALFELIFGIRAMRQLTQTLPESPGAAYDVLRETCAPFVPDGTEPQFVEAQVWSLIHGFCSLFLSQQFGSITDLGDNLGPLNKVMSLLDNLPLANRG